jgi:hypothetical protein
MFAVQVQIDQGEVRAQPVMVLRDSTVAHLSKPKTRFKIRNRPTHSSSMFYTPKAE